MTDRQPKPSDTAKGQSDRRFAPHRPTGVTIGHNNLWRTYSIVTSCILLVILVAFYGQVQQRNTDNRDFADRLSQLVQTHQADVNRLVADFERRISDIQEGMEKLVTENRELSERNHQLLEQVQELTLINDNLWEKIEELKSARNPVGETLD